MSKSHFHFIVQAYSSAGEQGQLADVVTVDLFANNENEAIDKSTKLVSKLYYRVSQIIEHRPSEEAHN